MFQKELYLYMKHLCLYAEKQSFLFFLFLGFVGGFNGKKPEAKREERTPVCCCENPVTLRIKCFCFLEESLTPPV